MIAIITHVVLKKSREVIDRIDIGDVEINNFQDLRKVYEYLSFFGYLDFKTKGDSEYFFVHFHGIPYLSFTAWYDGDIIARLHEADTSMCLTKNWEPYKR